MAAGVKAQPASSKSSLRYAVISAALFYLVTVGAGFSLLSRTSVEAGAAVEAPEVTPPVNATQGENEVSRTIPAEEPVQSAETVVSAESTEPTVPAEPVTPSSEAAELSPTPPSTEPEVEAVLTASPSSVLQGATVIELPKPADHAAYDETTANLITLQTSLNRAVIYHLEGEPQEVATIETGPGPFFAIAKRYQGKSLFVISSERNTQIEVFDASTGVRVGAVTAPAKFVFRLQSSENEQDPYVYYSAFSEDRPMFRRFHIGELREDGELPLDEGGGQISPRGDILYGNVHRAHTRFGGYDPLQIIEGERPYQRYENSQMAAVSLTTMAFGRTAGYSDEIVCDPHQCYMTDHITNLWFAHAQGENNMGTYGFKGRAFLRGTPWIFGIEEAAGRSDREHDLFRVASTNMTILNSETPLSEAPIPAIPDVEPQTQHEIYSRYLSYRARVFADAKRNRVVFSAGQRVLLIPLKSLKLPAERTLAFDLPAPHVLLLGTKLSVPVKVYDNYEATLKLVEHPAGMTLSKTELSWTPTAADVGRHVVQLERRRGDVLLTKIVAIDVRWPSINTSFFARGVALADSGKHAVIWGDDGLSASPGEAEQMTELAVVDLKAGQELVHRHFDQGVLTAAIDEHGVYLLSRPSTQISQGPPLELLHLKTADLTLIKRTNAHADSDLNQGQSPLLRPVAGRYLRAGATRFSLPGLDVTNRQLTSMTAESSEIEPHLDGRSDEGWIWDGVLWNDEFAKPKLLLRPVGFAAFGGNLSVYGQTPGLLAWGRLIHRESVSNLAQQSVSRSEHESTLRVSTKKPVAVWLQPVSSQYQDSTSLAITELSRGEKVAEILVSATSAAAIRGAAFDLVGDTGVGCAGGRVYPFLLSQLVTKPTAKPFRAVPEQSELTIGVGKGSVEYRVVDGTPPYDAVLTIGSQRLEARGPGELGFKIDVRKLLEESLRYVSSGNAFGAGATADNQPSAERLSVYLASVSPVYQRLTGRTPKGVPVLWHAHLQVKDTTLNSADLAHYYLLDLPKIEVMRRLGGESPELAQAQPNRAAPSKPTAAQQAKLQELISAAAVSYSNELRVKYPPLEGEPKELEAAWDEAVTASNKEVTTMLRQLRDGSLERMRTWSDRKGHSTRAQLKTVFADKVVLMLQRGGEVSLPLEKLSDPDQAFIENRGEPPTAAEIAVVRMQLVQRAIARHLDQTGGYPPAYVVDAKNKPLLSWRVLLLEDLGAGAALRVLRLNEPWSSRHNRQFLARMPLVYGDSDQAAGQGLTSIVSFSTNASIFANGRPFGENDLRDPKEGTLTLVSVADKYRIPWTNPRGIVDQTIANFPKVLATFNGRYLVAAADGSLKSALVGASPVDWREAIDPADRAVGQLKYGEVTELFTPVAE